MIPRSTALRMFDSSASPSTRESSSAKSAALTHSARSPCARVVLTKLKRCALALDAREQLADERRVAPLRPVALRTRRAHEVEEMRDRRRGLARVHDERVIVHEPAHRDLAAVALDGLALDRAALLRDVEQCLQ